MVAEILIKKGNTRAEGELSLAEIHRAVGRYKFRFLKKLQAYKGLFSKLIFATDLQSVIAVV